MNFNDRRMYLFLGLLGVGMLHESELALGQGTIQPIIMQTGSGNVLLTDSVSYTNSGGSGSSATLAIALGFATQEQPKPGVIGDSFTVSITGPGGVAYLVTLDSNGAQWAPVVPGSLPVSTSSIQHQSSTFLVASPGMTSQFAFSVGYLLPANWLGAPLIVNFDLYDNQDTSASLGYYLVSAPVPEPSTAALVILGLAAWRCRGTLLKRNGLPATTDRRSLG